MVADAAERTNDTMTLRGLKGAPEAALLLHASSSLERDVKIVCSPDRIRAYIRVIRGTAFKPLTEAGVVELLASAGIGSGVDATGISAFIALVNAAAPFEGFFQIARSSPMRRGEDGSIEFHVQPTAAVPRYDQSDSGSIDFKQLNLIENCFAGQRVATIVPPGPGRSGVDIFGGAIPAEPGRPVKLTAGPGVTIHPNGRDFTSEIEGRLIHEGDELSVSPVLEIAKTIDYSVGNIDFIGKVVVNGALLDGFSVSGKRGVEIRGDMGAATVLSEGDVAIGGGVKGKGAGFISCMKLKARYIDDSTVEASGDVSVEKEILHSTVKSLGKVSIPRGSILGGEVWGFRGVETDVIGSEMGVATKIVAGLNWTDENKLAEVRGKAAELSDRVQSSKMILDPLFAVPDITAQLSLDQKSMIADLILELRNLRDGLAQLLEEKERIMSRHQEGRVCQINVLSTVHMGASVRFTEVESEIKDLIKGPLSITQDVSGRTCKIGGMFNLAPENDPKPSSDGFA